jgi:hypothetical protein
LQAREPIELVQVVPVKSVNPEPEMRNSAASAVSLPLECARVAAFDWPAMTTPMDSNKEGQKNVSDG